MRDTRKSFIWGLRLALRFLLQFAFASRGDLAIRRSIERVVFEVRTELGNFVGCGSWSCKNRFFLRQFLQKATALDAARKELAAATEALVEREGEIRLWKNMYLQARRSRAVDTDSQPADVSGIEDIDQAIDAARKDFANRLEILEGRVAKEASQFEQPELLYAAFNWLAGTYWNARTGVEGCSDFDHSCRESCQFRYNAHQSEITMSMFAGDYEVNYGGSRVKLKEHIGYGVSTEPRHTIRVAFFFDESARKVVIGYIGQHQATRKSN
jgi:hypothetical protein